LTVAVDIANIWCNKGIYEQWRQINKILLFKLCLF